MHTKRNFVWSVCLALLFALVIAGCPMDGPTDPDRVSQLDLSGQVQAPIKDQTPSTTEINTAQYRGSVAWKKADGSTFTGAFAAATAYQAELNLTAKDGFTFDGVAANSFTYTGATVTNDAGNGTSLTVIITFPETADVDTTVTDVDLTAYVTSPVKNATPDTVLHVLSTNAQYSGSVAWQDNPTTFAAETVYTAIVTLNAASGFTFDEVAANSFTYSGATLVTNSAGNSTSLTVTITFPKTAADVDTPVTDVDLTAYVTSPVKNAAPDTVLHVPSTNVQYSGSVAWQGNPTTFASETAYTAIVTLNAASGFTFDGVTANSFTHTGATLVTNDAGNGKSLTVTITFPETTAAGAVDKVSLVNLTTYVTRPVKGATPDTTAIDTTQYTGSVAWKKADGNTFTGAFATATAYRAELSLTAKGGFTFDGVVADSFFYSGATVGIGSGASLTVIITFPATAADTVSLVNLTSYVTIPVKGATPSTAAIDTTQYTGSVAWKKADGSTFTGAFAAATAYRAELSLTAKGGFTFDGVVADSFTYTGATLVTNSAGNSTSLAVNITFPATAADTVSLVDLTLSVTMPVRGATPSTAAIDTTQYTGSVAWKKTDGSTFTGAFAAATAYRAELSLTAKGGFTFDGVAADSFTYTGATSVTNSAGNSTSLTVTITFPATGGGASGDNLLSGGQIYEMNWDKDSSKIVYTPYKSGETYVLKMVDYDASEFSPTPTIISENAGTVDTSGVLTLNLLSTIGANYMVSMRDSFKVPSDATNVEIIPSDLRSAIPSLGLYKDAREQAGVGLINTAVFPEVSETIQFLYASKAATLNGTVTVTLEREQQSVTFSNLVLQAGRNAVIIRNNSSTDATLTNASNSMDFTDWKWVLGDNGGGNPDGPGIPGGNPGDDGKEGGTGGDGKEGGTGGGNPEGPVIPGGNPGGDGKEGGTGGGNPEGPVIPGGNPGGGGGEDPGVTKYTVTRIFGHGIPDDTIEVILGTPISATFTPPPTLVPHWTFSHWTFESQVVTGPTTITAIWVEQTKHTVTFDDRNGVEGDDPEIQNVYHGEYAIQPADPTWDNHTFLGWAWNFSDPITTNKIIGALWKLN
ncbi:hypothetical protein AGMMS49928_02030 [Spirochaetia bacterium]|nr:hypothetical protein AGMMS49928_02030 [Spirochaetia bacterium]